MSKKNEPVVVSAVRTAVGRAFKGTLRETRPDDLAAACLTGALERAGGFDPADLDDIVLGCAMPEGPQGLNVARLAQFRAGIPYHVPAITVNRFCSSGLQSIAMAADRIATGQASVVVAGGTESMSMVPMTGERFVPNPTLVAEMPEAYISMGLTAEEVASRFDVSREDQDAFALESHRKAIAAIDAGVFADELVPVEIPGRKGAVTVVDTDEPPRRDTTLEALAKLRPAFAGDAPPEVTEPSVTAGNAPGLNDGAAATVVTSEAYARSHGLDILGRIAAYSVGATEPRDLFFAPITAVRRLMEKEGTTIDDYGLFEVNEAFAVQAIADARELGMDFDRINVRGGAIALGHPIGASGAKILTTLLYAMRDLDVDKGMATLCLGGGNAVALSVERA